MNAAYCPRFFEHVRDEPLLVLASQQTRDAGEPAQSCKPEQSGEPEYPECRDRPDQVQPPALVDEEVALRWRAAEVEGEVDQEDDADEVVVDEQDLVRGLA